MNNKTWHAQRLAGQGFAIVDETTGRGIATVRGNHDDAIAATLEGAWSEKALTAPRYIQCQLGEEVKRAISAIAKAEGRA